MSIDLSRFGSVENTKAHATESIGTYGGWHEIVESGSTITAEQSLSVWLDPTFSDEHKAFIKKALGFYSVAASKFIVFEKAVALAQYGEPAVWEGFPGSDAQKRRYKDEAWQWFTLTGLAFIAQFGNLFTIRGYPARLYIARIWGEPNPAGKGHIGSVNKTDDPIEFTIALNSDALMNPDLYLGTVPENWAGVIAHECLHNLGYDHPLESDAEFINCYGDCVLTYGAGTPPGVLPRRPMNLVGCTVDPRG